jgi:NADH-quinone oxidoreductase E subunit
LDRTHPDGQGSGVARLTPDNQRRARDLIALYPLSRSALIPILHLLQEQDGYLTDDGMEHVGEMLGLTGAEVRGTATFYDMFHLEPVGRYLVAVCTNIACMLQGAYRLLEHAEDRLGVAAGGTSKDRMFTLEDAECLALCGNAPCVTVNWRFFGDVDLDRFDALIDDLRAGRLADEVPPHGTLNRVPRTVGLTARAAGGQPGDHPGPPGADGTPAVPAYHPVVDLETHRTTAAVASLDAGHLGDET